MPDFSVANVRWNYPFIPDICVSDNKLLHLNNRYEIII